MFRKMIDSIRNLFASPEKRLELKTRELAMQTTQDFDNLQKIIKDGEYTLTDHQKVVNDREQFLRDNPMFVQCARNDRHDFIGSIECGEDRIFEAVNVAFVSLYVRRIIAYDPV